MKLTIVIFAILGSALAASIQNGVSKIPPFRRMLVNPILELPNANEHLGIINGNEVVPHSIPYQIYLEGSDSTGSWACGGSLITPRYALTAAHCVVGANTITVALGAHNIRKGEEDRVVITAKSFKAHEKYNPETIDNDIGIIELSSDATLSTSIGLATLPSLSDVNADLVGLQGRVSGWGLTDPLGFEISDVLREVNNTVISNSECNSIYGIITNKQICLSSDGDKTSCNGDSGGPMVVGNNQVGLVSFGAIGCLSYPSAYTRISQFLDWIQANSDYKST